MAATLAPDEIVAGALDALSPEIQPVLYGPPGLDTHGLPLVEARDVIDMDDSPVEAVRAKPDSSLVRAVRAVADGEADAVVSAGSTGAMLAASLLHIRRLPDVHRPGIAVVLPARNGPSVLIDAGANADARPEHLLQFAHMGSVFAEEILEVGRPVVRLLSIGEEDEKGNQLTLDAHALLRESELDFGGNTESNRLLEGDADVVVTDGFTGNVALKALEGTIRTHPRRLSRRAGVLAAREARRAPRPARGAPAPQAPRPRDVRRRLPPRPARARRHRARLELARGGRERDQAGRPRGRARRCRAGGAAARRRVSIGALHDPDGEVRFQSGQLA